MAARPAAPSGALSDLGKRVAVALVGIPAVLALLYFGGWVLAVPVALMAALAVREVSRLAGAHGARPYRWLGMPAAAALVLWAVPRPRFESFAPGALGVLALVAVVAMVSALFSRGPREAPLASVGLTVFGVVYGGLSLACAVLLHEMPLEREWGGVEASPWTGALVVVLPLAATWIGDAAAYFAGSAWGKRKLAPTISPKKSWVGLWAELVAAGLAGVAWFFTVRNALPHMPVGGPGTAALLGVLLGLGAVLGDLVESLFKREAGVKDSGTFFPGHGGVLDRLDALVFTLPLAYGLLVLLGTLA